MPQPADLYEQLAHYYDWEHDRFTDDLPLYRALVRRSGGPVLELASGTGRLLAPLAELGVKLYGIERSSAMLARARDRLAAAGVGSDRVVMLECDMGDFTLPEAVRLAFVGLDSFGHLLTRAEQIKTLGCALAALDPDGLLAIDLTNGNLRGDAQPELVHHLTAEDTETRCLVTKWIARDPDPSEQIDNLTIWYDAADEAGQVRRTTAEMRLRYFTRFEIELLVERAGFRIDTVYGSYALEPFGPTSERLIVLARPARKG